jgi:hypothetical protein
VKTPGSQKKKVGKRSSVDRIPCLRGTPGSHRNPIISKMDRIVCVCNRYTRKEFIEMRGPRNLIKMELSALGHRLNAGWFVCGANASKRNRF